MKILDAAAEALEVLQRQVDPVLAQILGHVLAVLGQLQRRADPVGELDTSRRGHAEDPQHELADRVCRERAVALQLGPGAVAAAALIEPVGLDQPRKAPVATRIGAA